jgi:YVTN family beta-propeller protein
VAGTGSYIAPRLIQASQINLNTGTEPRSLSDIINFTQKSNLTETQLSPLANNWEQALRTVNRYFGTSQVYKESCTNYFCLGGSPVPKDVETATITVGTSPLGVGIDTSTNRVYVANYGANSVTVIDGNTNTVVGTPIAVGTGPDGIGVNPNTHLVYVANNANGNGNSVSVINGTSNSVVGSPIIVQTGPAGVSVNPITNRVYVANSPSSSVSVINGTSNKVLFTITDPSLFFPVGVSVNPATNRVYVANQLSSSVAVINGTSNTVLTAIIVGNNPLGVAVNPTTNRVYVANGNPSSVSVINGTSNTVLTTITVGAFSGIGVNPSTNRIYVASAATNGLVPSPVSVIDGGTNTVITTVTVGSGGTPAPWLIVGVGVNPTTSRVYVANVGDNSVSVIGQREEIREACLLTSANCLVVSSTGTLFPGTPQATAVSLVALSLRSNATKTGTQMALTVVCDNKTTLPTRQCSAFYVDGNVWGPGQTDLSKSPFIIQNAEPYFYLQFHWWDFANSRIFAWSTWWYGTASNPNWFWGVYWSWRTYVNYYIGIPYIPWWWWSWHWTYWRYWAWWGTAFQA